MVGPGPPAHDTGAAGLVLARDAMGNAARSPAGPPARVCPLIPEACAHLQRCPGPRPPLTLDLADFRRLPGLPRRTETLSRRAQPPSGHRLPTAPTCKAKFRTSMTFWTFPGDGSSFAAAIFASASFLEGSSMSDSCTPRSAL